MGDGRKGTDDMTVKVLKNKSNKRRAVLYVSGRIDTNTAPELEKFIGDKLEGLKEMVLDFTKADYISSAGLRVLLATHKNLRNQKGKLIIKNPSDAVEEVLHITGFDRFMNIQGSDSGKKDAQTDEEEDVQIDEEDAEIDEDADVETDEDGDVETDEDEDVQSGEEEDVEIDESQEDTTDDDTEES